MDINSPDRIKNGFDSVISTSAPFKGFPIYVPPSLYSGKIKELNGGKEYNEVMLNTISKPITKQPNYSPSLEDLNKPGVDGVPFYPVFYFKLNTTDGSTKTISMNSNDLNKARAQIELEGFKQIPQPTLAQKARIYELTVYSSSIRYSRPKLESFAREVITDELARGNLIVRGDGKIVGKEFEFKDPVPEAKPPVSKPSLINQK